MDRLPEEAGAAIALIGRLARPDSAPRPLPDRAALTDPHLVPEPNFDRLALRGIARWAIILCGYVLIREKPIRLRSFPILRSLLTKPNAPRSPVSGDPSPADQTIDHAVGIGFDDDGGDGSDLLGTRPRMHDLSLGCPSVIPYSLSDRSSRAASDGPYRRFGRRCPVHSIQHGCR